MLIQAFLGSNGIECGSGNLEDVPLDRVSFNAPEYETVAKQGQKMKEPTGLKERVAFDSSAPNDLKLISHFASLLAVSRLTVG